jgi:hypothetical protein
MQVFVKLSPRAYDRLRSHVPVKSPAHEAIDKANRIDHSVEGVLFSGYSISCSEEEACILLGVAKQSCPEIISDIEKAIELARSGAA